MEPERFGFDRNSELETETPQSLSGVNARSEVTDNRKYKDKTQLIVITKHLPIAPP